MSLGTLWDANVILVSVIAFSFQLGLYFLVCK